MGILTCLLRRRARVLAPVRVEEVLARDNSVACAPSLDDEDVVDDCKRRCDERDGCTHFVSWANQACFTYETCDATDDGAAVDSAERVYVNVYRTKGKCEYGKSVAPGLAMGWN